MYHLFFIHSSISGHLGGFHVIPIVDSDTVNIRVHVSKKKECMYLFELYPGVGLLDHTAALFLVF